jgi:hypothetical protein
MELLELVLYLVVAGLLFPAFGGGIWLIESQLRQRTRLGRSISGGTIAKVIGGAAWLGIFFALVWVTLTIPIPYFSIFLILIWEAVGLYGAYRWLGLQEILIPPRLQV